MRADGTRRRTIARSKTLLVSPAWSPGGRIAFVRDDDIVIADADGANAAALGLREETITIRDLAWSPDGRTLSFVRDGLGDGNGIWFVDADGQNLRRLPRGLRPDESPVYSPNGKLLAFARVHPDPRAGYDLELWLTRPDGTAQRRLTRHSGWDLSPSWSPDGRRLVFSSARKAGSHARGRGLYVFDVWSGTVSLLYPGPGTSTEPAWQPVPR